MSKIVATTLPQDHGKHPQLLFHLPHSAEMYAINCKKEWLIIHKS